MSARIASILAVFDAALAADAEAVIWIRRDDDVDAIDLAARAWTAAHSIDREMDIETAPPTASNGRTVRITARSGHYTQPVATIYSRGSAK